MSGTEESGIRVGEPTGAEKEFRRLSRQSGREGLSAIRDLGDVQSGFLDLTAETIGALGDEERIRNAIFGPEDTADLARAELERRQALLPIETELMQARLDMVRNAGELTPELAARIDAATGAAQEVGERDISRFADEQLERIREELAPAVGLRPGETPLIDRGGLVAREAIRSQEDLSSRLAAENARLRLEFPLQQQAATSQQIAAADEMAKRSVAFQQDLANAAQANRLRLLGQGAGQQVSLAGAFQNQFNISNAAMQGQQNFRVATGTQFHSMSQIQQLQEGARFGGQIIGGIGAIAMGVGGAGGGAGA